MTDQTTQPTEQADSSGSNACYSASRTAQGVWIAGDFSVSRMIAMEVMDELRMNKFDDFRTRDRIINAICDRVDGTLDAVALPLSQMLKRRLLSGDVDQLKHLRQLGTLKLVPPKSE